MERTIGAVSHVINVVAFFVLTRQDNAPITLDTCHHLRPQSTLHYFYHLAICMSCLDVDHIDLSWWLYHHRPSLPFTSPYEVKITVFLGPQEAVSGDILWIIYAYKKIYIYWLFFLFFYNWIIRTLSTTQSTPFTSHHSKNMEIYLYFMSHKL